MNLQLVGHDFLTIMVCGVSCYVSYVTGGYITYSVILLLVDPAVAVVIHDVPSHGSGSTARLVTKENIPDITTYCKIIKIHRDPFSWID